MQELGRAVLAYFGLAKPDPGPTARALAWPALVAGWSAGLLAATVVCGLLASVLAERSVTAGGIAARGIPFGIGVTLVLVLRDLHQRRRSRRRERE